MHGSTLITAIRNRYRQRHGQSGGYKDLALDMIAATGTEEKITRLYLSALNARDNKVTTARAEVFAAYLEIDIKNIATSNKGGSRANKPHRNQYSNKEGKN